MGQQGYINPRNAAHLREILARRRSTSVTMIGDYTNTVTFSSPASIGRPVYVDGNDSVDLAQANSVATADVIGLASDTETVQTAGIVEATTAEWDVVTGGSGGLTAGAAYFLSADTAGELTDTAPSTVGQLVVPVGIALATTKLSLTLKHKILL